MRLVDQKKNTLVTPDTRNCENPKQKYSFREIRRKIQSLNHSISGKIIII